MMSRAGIWLNLLDQRYRTRVLVLSGVFLVAVALVDWRVPRYVALGFLYLFPVMLSALFLPRWTILLLGVVCAVLSELFSYLDRSDAIIRMGLEALAFAGCGLFVAELVRSRRLTMEAEQRLRVLVETSPTPIVTVNESGLIERANDAAADLMVPRGGSLVGEPVAAFLPELHHVLRNHKKPRFRTTLHCRGQRGDGGSFSADVWFSTYWEGPEPKLAAIIAGVTPDRATAGSRSASSEVRERVRLDDREREVLRLVAQGQANKDIATTLNVSKSVVKNVLQQLFIKTEVHSRGQLVRVALERYRDLL
jgi:DNA-binding CsgD family transcriptional regulator